MGKQPLMGGHSYVMLVVGPCRFYHDSCFGVCCGHKIRNGCDSVVSGREVWRGIQISLVPRPLRGPGYEARYRCATHMTKVFVKTRILFLQCGTMTNGLSYLDLSTGTPLMDWVQMAPKVLAILPSSLCT